MKNQCFSLITIVRILNKILASRAKLKVSEGHIWPAGRMLSTPAFDDKIPGRKKMFTFVSSISKSQKYLEDIISPPLL
jgi:hypothetical protein